MFGTRAIEIIAVLCGIANVVLIIRRSLWNYPFGLVMVALYAWIFFEVRLYSDTLLQVFFFVVQLFGVVWWLRGRDAEGDIIVRRLSKQQVLMTVVAAVVGTIVLGATMSRWTDAALPFPDAAIASMSVLAQILLARRFLENWLLWIAVDVLTIGVYFSKDLHPTAVLYALFLLLAITGLLDWRRALNLQMAKA
jgi:nicotinamide mononucleotide transporter